jgi:spermidine synthase
MARTEALTRETPANSVRGVSSAGWLLPLLLLLFFVSGTSALIYQVLWLRLLALVFGVTVWAVATVVASFMAGLAIGSYGAGRMVDRARNPLLWFGIAEGAVGLAALATPSALTIAERVYTALYAIAPDQIVILTAARFIVSSAVLIVPTTLMGATLPIVVKSSLTQGGGLDSRVGLLYAVNTTGAVVGTLLAGFLLIGAIGMSASFGIAVAGNVFIAIAAIGASRFVAKAAPRAGGVSTTSAPADQSIDLSARARRAVLIVFTLSGATSMAQEVIWFRLLVFFQQISTYAFTTMLAAFLTGIAGGSYLAALLMRRRMNWLQLLAILECAIAVLTVGGLLALAATERILPSIMVRLGPEFREAAPVAAGVASFLALLPMTTLLGVAFPIGLRLWAAGSDASGGQSGRDIGTFYSLNVIGAILGSVLAGFVLLPGIGSRASLIVTSAITLGGGLLLASTMPNRRRAIEIGVLGTAAFVGLVAIAPDPFDVINRFRYGGHEVVWREEGVQTTVSVHRLPDRSLAMFLDGHNQATDSGYDIHVEIGTMPLALHPRPRSALVIGLGGGATAGAVAAFPGVEVDVVELSGSVARGSELFRHINGDVLHRTNVRLIVEDGRNHLMLTPKRYDVITADIIWPYHAGAGNLYSREYFQLARNALADDGVMLQWLGKMGATRHKLVMRTFLDVFPEATLWKQGAFMVGTRKPYRLDEAALERKLADPAVRAHLATIGISSRRDLIERYAGGTDEMRAYVGVGPLLTDDQPRVEYYLSLPMNEGLSDIERFKGDPRAILSP